MFRIRTSHELARLLTRRCTHRLGVHLSLWDRFRLWLIGA